MEYTVIWTEKSRKNLEIVPKDVAERIIVAVESITTDPFRHIDRLAGSSWYKYRIGKYRVILDIKRHTLIIFVLKAGPRRRVYQDL